MQLFTALALLLVLAAPAVARQAAVNCPPAGWTPAQLTALKADKFAIDNPSTRRTLAIALTGCLGDPNPSYATALRSKRCRHGCAPGCSIGQR